MARLQAQRSPRLWVSVLAPLIAVTVGVAGCSSDSKSRADTSVSANAAGNSRMSSPTDPPPTTGTTVTDSSTTETTATTTTVTPTTSPSSPPLSVDEFQTPSGNIGCAIYEGGVRCDAGEQSWNVPHDPECDVDFGDALYLDSSGSGFSCHGDTVRGMGTILDYGSSTQVGNITCTSEESGVTCTESTSGHWFMISRERYELG